MATPLETSFLAWKFSEEELAAARNLHTEQRMYLQTLLSDAAEQKLGLKLDPYKPLVFTQEDAYLRGQIDILFMLLDSSNTKVARPRNATIVTPTT